MSKKKLAALLTTLIAVLGAALSALNALPDFGPSESAAPAAVAPAAADAGVSQ